MAEVIVDVAASPIDRPLDYRIPPEFQGRVQVGHRVLVPLRGRPVEGFVTGTKGGSDREGLLSILRLLDERPVFGREEVELATWMSARFLVLRVDALRCLLPPHTRLTLRKKTTGARPLPARFSLAPLSDEEWARLLAERRRRAPAQARILQVLRSGAHERADLLAKAEASDSALRALERSGIVLRERPPFSEGQGCHLSAGGEDGTRALTLTASQQAALEVVRTGLYGNGGFRPILLHGVTGSGKTEVYMQAAAEALRSGGQVLILVPEIALTPQAVERFRARFGSRVALWHSRLAAGERVETWWRVRRGEAPLVLGTRSAVFAPFTDLRLIVVDEEHDPSYKQEDAPRYHARDVAWERARRSGALLLLGSATPSLETYWRAQQGEVIVVRLPERVNGRSLPPVELVDMREELRAGWRGVLSRRLLDALASVVSAGGQAMLFINRRGYSSFVLCRECGQVVGCPDCAVSLTYHAAGHELRCHYCDWRQPLPDRCPACGSPLLRRFGAGTQRVEEAVRAALPGVRTLRMDVDTTRRKGDMERILDAFRHRRADVLVGTQMIAKGHDFPGVALVGAVAADSTLYLPDFRAAERTFQLLAQAAGRAGRGEAPGTVIVQTYNPGHYSIQAACAHDYDGFVAEEMRFRRIGQYPPVRRLARLLFAGPDSDRVRDVAVHSRREASADLAGLKVDVLGPAPAPLSRVQGRYRWHVLIKGERGADVRAAAAALRAAGERLRPKAVSISVDVDPVSLM